MINEKDTNIKDTHFYQKLFDYENVKEYEKYYPADVKEDKKKGMLFATPITHVKELKNNLTKKWVIYKYITYLQIRRQGIAKK